MKRKYGCNEDVLDSRDFLYSHQSEFLSLAPLPPKVNLSPLMSPIENQGSLGSCVAHATCGVLEFLEMGDLKGALPLPEYFGPNFNPISRLFVYFNARKIDGDTQVDGGTQIRSAILSLRNSGICRESLWAYDVAQVFTQPSVDAYREGLKHKVIAGYRVDNTQMIEMKQCLANGFPFVVGISVFDSFESQQVAATGMVPMPDRGENLLGGHALCVVGYDDSLNCFLVRNSWGVEWGLAGYCYIPYGYISSALLCNDCWTIRKQ